MWDFVCSYLFVMTFSFNEAMKTSLEILFINSLQIILVKIQPDTSFHNDSLHVGDAETQVWSAA